MMSRTRRWFGAAVLWVMLVAGVPGRAWGQSNENGLLRQLGEAESLTDEATRLYDAGQYDKAIPLAERALGIRERVLGTNHSDVARSLNNLAMLYKTKGEYARAEPLYVRALGIREIALGPNHLDVAMSLNNLAMLYHAKGEYARAEPMHVRALSIREAALGPNHPDVAMSLNNLAMLYNAKGEYARAEPLFVRSLGIREVAFGPNSPNVATALSNLAGLYCAKGEYVRAEPLFVRSLSIREVALGSNHPHVSVSLSNLAVLYQAKGDYTRVEPLLLRALHIMEAAFGPDHPAVATVLDNLAQLHDAMGDFALAEPLLLRALHIQEIALGPSHPDVAASLGRLAGLYHAKWDYSRAERHYLQALKIRENALGSNHPDVATSLNNLAGLYHVKGDYARAEPLYLRALNIWENAFGSNHPDVASSLNNLAGLYSTKGDYARAEPLHLRALNIRENALGPYNPDVATSLNNLAHLYKAIGDDTRAEPHYLRALSIWENAFGPNHPEVARVLENLATLYWGRNNTNSILPMMDRAATIKDENASRQVAVGTADQRRLYMDALRGESDTVISLHIQAAGHCDDAKRLALRTILRRKGLTIDAMTNSFVNLRERLTPEGQTKFDNWRTLTAQYSAMVQHGPGKEDIDTFRASLKTLNENREKAETELTFIGKDLQAQLRSVTIEQVQAALPKDAALVELFRYKPYKPKVKGTENRWGIPRFVAYVLLNSGKLDYVDLGEAKPIEDAVKAMRLALSTEARDTKPAGRDLYQHVMKPIIKLIGRTKHVYLSPDGALNLVPFGAMIAPDGHYLAEHLAITYLTTGRDLARPRGPKHRQHPVVFSAPNFEAGDSNKPRAERSFDLLWAGTVEGHAVQAQLPNAMLFDGRNATESALKALDGPEVVHISTHGFFEKDLSALHEPRLQPFDMQPPPPIENALLRSGLVFAGANRGGVDKEDGILTALEASQLDLWGTKLVVLSACETGRGQVENGDGIYGLRRAFTIAGAETVVMSLWKVDADATTELVTQYYDGLSKGGGRAEALRQAQLGMLADAKHSHPHYWASFIVSGNDSAMAGHPVEPTFGRITRGGICGACEIGTHESSGSGVWIGIAISAGAALGLRRRGVRVENRQ